MIFASAVCVGGAILTQIPYTNILLTHSSRFFIFCIFFCHVRHVFKLIQTDFIRFRAQAFCRIIIFISEFGLFPKIYCISTVTKNLLFSNLKCMRLHLIVNKSHKYLNSKIGSLWLFLHIFSEPECHITQAA